MQLKFYESRAFRALNAEWRLRLKKSGFDDLESDDGRLRQKNIRTQNFENRGVILEFHLRLNSFLVEQKLPKTHRRILELYSGGEYVKDIVEKTGLSDRWVRKVIHEYKIKIG